MGKLQVLAKCQVPGCAKTYASASAYRRHFKACELKYWNNRNKVN